VGDDISIAVKGECLLVNFSGEFNERNARSVVDEMVGACLQHECKRILLNCTEMTGEMPQLTRFFIAQYGADMIPSRIKVGILIREDQVDPDEFFETAARNRGVLLSVFTDGDAAGLWQTGQALSPDAEAPPGE
jgi:hypothetical protein